MTRGWLPAALWLLVAVAPVTAHARVERFAVLVGNNHGDRAETPLRFAEADAERMYDVLQGVGGFEPANMVLLRGGDPKTLVRTLIAINDRVRQAQSQPGTQAMLVVYYSGHADGEALHLGGERLPMLELAQLVRGSSASLRLLVLDACASGAVTRSKGGRITTPFALPDETLPSDGLAFLTASSEREDAHESDALGGSFFTHALISGLLGAADRDGDGAVVLEEAYRYAYDATLRATSQTLAGTQHPSFRYDLRGQGELVLTRPLERGTDRAHLSFPEGVSFLITREHADGAVVAELMKHDASRTLSLRSGRYFVRARGADVLYEGVIAAASGATTAVSLDKLERIEYARLVRKGGHDSRLAHGPEIGVRARSMLPNSTQICAGVYAGYAIDFETFGVALRGGACQSELERAALRASVFAYDIEARVYHAWDLASPFSLAFGVLGGASLLTQSFETAREAPDRQALAPYFGLSASAALELWDGFDLRLECAGETHVLRLDDDSHTPDRSEVALAIRASLGVGKRF